MRRGLAAALLALPLLAGLAAGEAAAQTPGITLSKTHVTVDEMDTAPARTGVPAYAYTIRLDTEPRGVSVTVDASPTTSGKVKLGTSTHNFANNTTLVFWAFNWNQPQTVYVWGYPDADAANEKVTLTHRIVATGSPRDYPTTLTLPSVEVAVVDDEGPGVRINAPDLVVSESKGTFFSVDFSGSGWTIDGDGPDVEASSGTATVREDRNCGNALHASSFDVCVDTSNSGWDGGSEILDLTIVPYRDATIEGEETFTVTFEGEGARETATFTFTVRDAPVVTVAPAGGGFVTEGEDAAFTLTATPPPARSLLLCVQVEEAPGTGFVQSSHTGERIKVVSASGTATFTVPTTDDGTFGPDGRVHLRVVPGNGCLAHFIGEPSFATVDVRDNDRHRAPDGPLVGVSALAASVFEGQDAAFAVTAVPAPESPLTVSLTVADAGGGSDFLASGQQGSRTVTVTVPAGDDRYDEPGYAEEVIPTVNDRRREASGDVTVTVNGGSGYAVTPNAGVSHPRAPRSSATIRVNDDDGTLPVVTITGGGTVTEGEEAVFTLTASPAPAALTELVVNLTVTDVDGSDFLAPVDEGTGKKAVIPAGASTVTWRLPTVDDATGEASGEVRAFLGAGRGYRVGSQSTAGVQVNDNDGLPRMNNDNQQTTVLIVRDLELEGLIQARIDLTAQRGDAHSNRIWRRALAAVQGAFPPKGMQPLTAAFAQKLADNHTRRGNAELSELWQRIAHVLLGATAQQAETETVLPVVTVTAGPTVTEGEPARFTLRADPAPETALTVTLVVAEKGSSGDHVAASDEGLAHATIPAGAAQAAFAVATVDDREQESDGPVWVAVGKGAGYTASPDAAAAVTVKDDDAYPLVSVSGNGPVVEGGTIEFTLTADRAPEADLTVHFEIRPKGDFLTFGGVGQFTATIPAGGTTAVHRVATVDDAHWEPDGSVRLSLRGSFDSPYRLGQPDHAIVAVTNDDARIALPSVSVADAQGHESSRQVVFTATLDAPPERPVAVRYKTRETQPVSARAWQDFIPRSYSTVHFAPGETQKEILVLLIDDSHDEDPERFELVLSGAKGARIGDGVAIGTIVNSDRMPAAWLARFGRTVAQQALDGVAGRLTAARAAGFQGSLGGQALAFGGAGGDMDASMAMAGLARLFAPGSGIVAGSGARGFGAARVGGADQDAGVGTGGGRPLAGGSPAMTTQALLLGSSFSLTSQPDGSGGSLAFWGRGSQASFDGQEASLALDGSVTTGMLGADYARNEWLIGLALLHSTGEGGYRNSAGNDAGMAGEVESSLTAALPYAAVQATDRLQVWGTAGYGSGEVTLQLDSGAQTEAGANGASPAMKADTDWTMAAAGLRGDMLTPPAPGSGSGAGSGSGPMLAVVSDALWARTSSDKTRDLAVSESDVTRLRLGLEGSYRLALDRETGPGSGSGASLTPTLALGARHDGGDAETGFGVELGGGLAWVDPTLGLSLNVEGRTLLEHEAEGLKDRGYAASLAYDPAPASARGLSVSLGQETGGPARGGLDALFASNPLAARQGSTATSRWTLGAAYGVPVFSGQFTGSPYLNLGLAETVRDYNLGWRLAPEGGTATALTFGVQATRRESETAAPDHRIGFEIGAQW